MYDLNSQTIYRSWYQANAAMILHDWRIREPIEHAIEPLPVEMHTHATDTIMTNREANEQARWNLEYGKT